MLWPYIQCNLHNNFDFFSPFNSIHTSTWILGKLWPPIQAPWPFTWQPLLLHAPCFAAGLFHLHWEAVKEMVYEHFCHWYLCHHWIHQHWYSYVYYWTYLMKVVLFLLIVFLRMRVLIFCEIAKNCSCIILYCGEEMVEEQQPILTGIPADAVGEPAPIYRETHRTSIVVRKGVV